ncbi:SHOCT domain-containing protein [Marinomonas aquiplantarum]|uniref:Putative oligomerization/nucleic acid binding protein n=1 Tax=Marinomonas aquiplantarum TaxID=491951 RepID=A0A366CXH6_9GAMM|nr:SHOCT domain-containing protein [Marinomonas aquiplantarum]RBO82537.1 putative oligomerization/nucleic acid binding protein [Marinomonas aquiplantarum]
MNIKAVMYLILGLIVPIWPISLPIFWFLAYKATQDQSKTAESPPPTQEAEGSPSQQLKELTDAKELFEKGLINKEEFNTLKSNLLINTEQT